MSDTQLPFNGGTPPLILDDGTKVTTCMAESFLGDVWLAVYQDLFGNSVTFIIEGPYSKSEWANTIKNDHGGIGFYLHYMEDKVQAVYDNRFVYGDGPPVTNDTPYTLFSFNQALKQYTRSVRTLFGFGPLKWKLLA